MKRRTHWAWKIYLVIYSLIALLDLMVLFSQGSPISEYYRVLIAFKTRYYVPYYFYIAKIFVEAISLIPLFLFVFRIRFLPTLVWKILFCARVALLFLGQSYEWNVFRSMMHASPVATLAALSVAILFALPSYIAFIQYAFYQKNLFNE